MRSEVTERRLLTSKKVRARYDGISDMTLHRWGLNPELQFPRPIYIGRFRYWDEEELLTWERSRPNVGKPFGAARPRPNSEAA